VLLLITRRRLRTAGSSPVGNVLGGGQAVALGVVVNDEHFLEVIFGCDENSGRIKGFVDLKCGDRMGSIGRLDAPGRKEELTSPSGVEGWVTFRNSDSLDEDRSDFTLFDSSCGIEIDPLHAGGEAGACAGAGGDRGGVVKVQDANEEDQTREAAQGILAALITPMAFGTAESMTRIGLIQRIFFPADLATHGGHEITLACGAHAVDYRRECNLESAGMIGIAGEGPSGSIPEGSGRGIS
jgi:hypothetical protein